MNSIFIFPFSIDLKNYPVSEVHKIDFSKNLVDWIRPTLDLTHKPIQRTMDHTTANAILGAKGFKLREGYQEQGVNWMLKKEWLWNPEEKPKLTDVYGGILADEMGLGKTIQTIAVMETNRFCNTLLIVPASLIEQWVAEIHKFSSNLEPHVCAHGNYLGLLDVYKKPGSVFITSYQTFVAHYQMFTSVVWFRVILDEAHYIRNIKTSVATRIFELKAYNKWALTGTPMQNSIRDLKTLLKFLGHSPDNPNIEEVLRDRMLLRTKKGVGIEIPEKREEIIKIEPTEFEREVQNYVAMCMDFDLGDNEDSIVEMDYHCQLERFLRMRQVSIGISIFLESYLKKAGIEIPGAKNTRLQEIVKLASTLDNAIIFCDFQAEMKYLHEKLSATDKRVGVIHGGVSFKKRAQILEEQKNYDILIIQIYAGGTGLNLQSFSNVIIDIPHYNPFIEEQAIGRAYRDGQKREVCVYRLIDESSIDARIREIGKIKMDTFNEYIKQ